MGRVEDGCGGAPPAPRNTRIRKAARALRQALRPLRHLDRGFPEWFRPQEFVRLISSRSRKDSDSRKVFAHTLQMQMKDLDVTMTKSLLKKKLQMRPRSIPRQPFAQLAQMRHGLQPTDARESTQAPEICYTVYTGEGDESNITQPIQQLVGTS